MKISFIEFKPIDKDIYYIFYIEYRGFEWHIRKRFSNFHSLYLELVKKYERVPKIEKTLLSVDYTKRLDDIVAFINYIVYNFCRFKSENYIMDFFYSDIFVNSVDDFISINKNKQREYVKNFLSDSKVANYKNYITTLENQIVEIVDKKRELLKNLEENSVKLNKIEEEYFSIKLRLVSIEAENKELRRIYETQKSSNKDLSDLANLFHEDCNNYLDKISQLESLNKEFRHKYEITLAKLEEAQKISTKPKEEPYSNYLTPSAPPMPDYYRLSLSNPPSLK